MSTGDECMKMAEATLEQNSWFWGPSNIEKIDTANNLYKKAVSLYRSDAYNHMMNESYTDAANTFIKIADLQLNKLNDELSAAENYINSAKIMKKYDDIAAIQYFEKAIELYNRNGNFGMGAKICETIAGIAEKNNMTDCTILAYQNAYKYYTCAFSEFSAITVLEKLTQILINTFQYELAFVNFDKLASYHKRNLSTHDEYKNCLFDSFICKIFVNDLQETKNELLKYKNSNDEFAKTTEYNYLTKFINVYEQHDVEGYWSLINNFNSYYRFHEWHQKLFVNLIDRINKK